VEQYDTPVHAATLYSLLQLLSCLLEGECAALHQATLQQQQLVEILEQQGQGQGQQGQGRQQEPAPMLSAARQQVPPPPRRRACGLVRMLCTSWWRCSSTTWT
jgi:hypothetical protein